MHWREWPVQKHERQEEIKALEYNERNVSQSGKYCMQ